MRSPFLVLTLGATAIACQAAGPDAPLQSKPDAWTASYSCTSPQQPAPAQGKFLEFWVMSGSGFYEWDTTVRLSEGTNTTEQRVHMRTTRRDDRLAVLWRPADPPPPENTYTIITPKSLYILADGSFEGVITGPGLKGACKVIGHKKN